MACSEPDTGSERRGQPDRREQAVAPRAQKASPEEQLGIGPPLRIPTDPSVIVLSVDTLRSDRLPMYGYSDVETPALDRLRADSILFERAYSPIPLTLPAHASMFTGNLPAQHGVRDNTGYRLEDAAITAAELMQARGYKTGAAVSSFVLRKASGIAQGFDFYDDGVLEARRGTAAESWRVGAATLKSAQDWLGSLASDDRAFLFVHLYEPHAPYAPAPEFADTYRERPYDGEIATVDRLVGGFLDVLRQMGRYDSSTIFFLSDHGEGLGQHGEDQHGILLYREALQIPLLVKLPESAQANSIVPHPVQLSDVFPTILEVAGIKHRLEPESDAVSLLDESSLANPRPLYAEAFYSELRLGWRGLRSVIDGGHHYIEGVYGELFDLEQDPGETRNIANQQRPIVRNSQRLLAESRVDLERPESVVTDRDAAALRDLGYLVASSATAVSNKDPRQEIGSLQRYYEGLSLLKRGQPAEALLVLEQVVAQQPELLDAWQFLGVAAEESGRPKEAYAAFRKALSLGNGSGVELLHLGRLALALGKTEEAIEVLPMAIKVSPADTEPRALFTQALVAKRKFDEALIAAEKNHEALPNDLDLHYQLGLVQFYRREVESAEQRFEEVLRIDPTYVPALADLAVLVANQGRWSRARELLQTALEVRPGDRQVQENLRFVESQLRQISASG